MSINRNSSLDFRSILGAKPDIVDRGNKISPRSEMVENVRPGNSTTITIKSTTTNLLSLDLDGSKHAYHPNDEGIEFNVVGGINKEEALRNEFRERRGYGIAKYRVSGQTFFKGFLQPNGYFVSQTTLVFKNIPNSDPEKYVDSESVPYLAVNPFFRNAGVKEGDIGYIVNETNGLSSFAIFADYKNKTGTEISLALTFNLEIPVFRKNAHSYDGRKIVVKYNGIENRKLKIYGFKGSGNGFAKTASEIQALGDILKKKFLNDDQHIFHLKSDERMM